MAGRVLLTDVDNTLFSWIDFFAPCFRALVHAVAQRGQLDEDELYDGFQLTFVKEGSVEYRRAIQDNLVVRLLPDQVQQDLTNVGTIAFGQAMRRHLKPYPDVKSTLRRLRFEDVKVVAVTNSGALQALDRLRRLGINGLVDGIVAWDHDVAGRADSETEYDTLLAGRAQRSGVAWVRAIPTEQLKPNQAAYQEAFAGLGLAADNIWILGDSLYKDLSPAAGLGATSIWARYGQRFEQRNFNTLLRITHWSEEKIRTAYDDEVLVPDRTIESFSELLDIIDLRQGELF